MRYLRAPFDWLAVRLSAWAAVLYVAAGSLIGLDALAVLIGYGIALPELVPIAVLVLAAVYFVRARLRKRATPTD